MNIYSHEEPNRIALTGVSMGMGMIGHSAGPGTGHHGPSKLRGLALIVLLVVLMVLVAWLVRDVHTPTAAPCSASCYR